MMLHPFKGGDGILRVLLVRGLDPEQCGVTEKAPDSRAVHL